MDQNTAEEMVAAIKDLASELKRNNDVRDSKEIPAHGDLRGVQMAIENLTTAILSKK